MHHFSEWSTERFLWTHSGVCMFLRYTMEVCGLLILLTTLMERV